MAENGINQPGSPRSSFRGDIEGLRAIAVLLVLAGHAAGNLVPGGFVGVDVFFVISGFLITGLLVGELRRTGRISLTAFYARRAKRLLPAAVLVLVVSLLLAYTLLPRTRWSATGWDVVASAVYGMNWRLAAQAVDYWAADQAPSIVQHFWSLAVEEQFYLVWPLLLLVLALPARRRAVRPALLMVGFVLVAVPSFAWSVWLTRSDPGPAYFVTSTRLWELALGGALAIAGTALHCLPRALAAPLAWAGLGAVTAGAFVLGPDTPFPGTAALLPTLGTAAVIGCSVAAGRAGPAGMLGLAPFRAVGAVSYSLYLWHWPLLVVAEAGFGELTPVAGLIVVSLSAVPAVLSYRFVENPIRLSKTLQWEPAAALRIGAACTGVAVAAGLMFQFTVWPPPQAPVSTVVLPPLSTAQATASATTPAGPPGAAVLTSGKSAGAPADRVASVVPDPLTALKDGPEAWPDKCTAGFDGGQPSPCLYGDADSAFRVALVGDSHANQWLPALRGIADANNWRLESYVRQACPFLNRGIARENRPQPECLDWNQSVLQALTGERKPNLLVVSHTIYVVLENGEPVENRVVADRFTEAMRTTWREVTAAKVPVAVIRDTPYQSMDIPECVTANPRKLTRCTSPRDVALATGAANPMLRAVVDQPRVHLIDLTDSICPTERCAPVIGGVLIYRDSSHLTATYVTTLAPRLNDALRRLLD